MEILKIIGGWQERAAAIPSPEGLNIQPSRGGLLGPAFFPEAYGLADPWRVDQAWKPAIVVVGHNWGCVEYREKIGELGREDDKPTWRGLNRVLTAGGGSIADCFMTNWFVGLLPGAEQLGPFLPRPDVRFEAACRDLLLAQLDCLRPRTVILLGLEVARRAHEIFPEAIHWSHARNWKDIDGSPTGPVIRGADVSAGGFETNLCALLHPSLAWPNRRYRRSLHAVDDPEALILRHALAN